MVILFGACLLLCGCNGGEPKPSNRVSSIEDDHYQIRRKLSIPKTHESCKLLASGYLVCPKARR
jgi:hypothetical protein